MSASPPIIPYIKESTIIEAPLRVVWPLCHPKEYSKYYSILKESYVVPQEGFCPEVVRWEHVDGHLTDFMIEQCNFLDHSVTWNVVTSVHPLSYAASGSTIRAHAITFGKHKGHTFVEFSGEYSSDVNSAILEDGKFKRRDALEKMAEYIKTQGLV